MHRLSCSSVCEIFLDQESNLCLLLWWVDSLLLCHQGSPTVFFMVIIYVVLFKAVKRETRGINCGKVKSLSHVWFFATPWTVATRLLHSWDFPDKNTGVGSCSLLQGIFLTRGSNPGLLHCMQTLCPLNHQEYVNLLFITTVIYTWTRKSRGTNRWLGWITTQ